MKTVHVICNAHLDPVWLWEWEEGAAEAISTFRTAAYFCEKIGPMLTLSDNSVLVTATKKAEKNSSLILRLFEPTLWEIKYLNHYLEKGDNQGEKNNFHDSGGNRI